MASRVPRLLSHSVLGCVRLSAAPLVSSSCSPSPLSSLLPHLGSRLFAAKAATYLDRDEVTERVLNVVKSFPKADPAKVTPTSNFQKDLGLDSLDVVEVVMAFEEEFAVEIPDADADKIFTTTDAINYFASHPQAK